MARQPTTQFGSEVSDVAPLQSSVTPQQGVQRAPTLAQGISGLFDQAGQLFEASAQKKQASAISEFIKQQTLVADAVAQQGRSSMWAKSMMRKNFLAAIDANPAIASELMKAQGTLIGIPGIGQIADTGDQAEQDRTKLVSSLVMEGMLDPDADTTTQNTAITNFRLAAQARERHQMRMNTLNEEKASLELSGAQRREKEAQMMEESVRYIQDVSTFESQKMRADLDKIVNDGTLSAAEKTMAVQDYWQQWNVRMQQDFQHIDQSKLSGYLRPFEMLIETYTARADGSLSAEALQNEIDGITRLNQLQIMVNDPQTARALAASRMVNSEAFGSLILNSDPGLVSRMGAFIKDGTSESTRILPPLYATDPTDRIAVRTYLKGLGELANGDAEDKAEAVDRIGKVIESAEDYEALIRNDPRAGIELVNFMASADFPAVVAAAGLSAEDISSLHQVLEANYEDEVWGMVENEFVNAKVTVSTPDTVDVNGQPVSTGTSTLTQEGTSAAVGARTTENGMEFFALDPTNKDFVNEARRLNRDLKPVINNTLKAAAHLQGRTDYGAIWDQVANQFLGGGVTESRGGDTGDDLVLSDYAEISLPLVNVANSSTLMEAIDRTEGGGRYDTLFGHSQKAGGRFEGVDVSKMTIGQAINFTNVNGEYGQWVKGKLASSGQKARVATPMGRYQIVGSTLRRVAGAMGLDMNTPFDSRTQDAMFAFLAEEALSGKTTMAAKRRALRGVWEGFKHVSDGELNAAIMEFES